MREGDQYLNSLSVGIRHVRGANGGAPSSVTSITGDQPLFDPWADLDPPEWPAGIFEREYETMLAHLALRDGCDHGALSMAYMAAISGAAHKDMRFAPFQHGEWLVPPIIYVMTVSDPGLRKTLLIGAAFAALEKLDQGEYQAWQDALAQWNKLTPDEQRNTDKPEEPAPLIVSDILVEKLQKVLTSSPRGVLMLRDEIAPMFDFRRYTHGSGAAERAFYLTAYEGGVSRVHRLGRNTERGAATGMTVYGGIQLDRLGDFDDLGNDGLLQRFAVQVVAQHNLSRPAVQVHGKHRLDGAITKIAQRHWHDVYSTTPDGSALIRHTEELGHRMAAIIDYGKAFQGFCYKLHGLHARLAFLLHLLDAPGEYIIPASTIERAARLAFYCLGHFRAFCSRVFSKTIETTKAIAGWHAAAPAARSAGPADRRRLAYRRITLWRQLCLGRHARPP
jgi:hypothetical protein